MSPNFVAANSSRFFSVGSDQVLQVTSSHRRNRAATRIQVGRACSVSCVLEHFMIHKNLAASLCKFNSFSRRCRLNYGLSLWYCRDESASFYILESCHTVANAIATENTVLINWGFRRNKPPQAHMRGFLARCRFRLAANKCTSCRMQKAFASVLFFLQRIARKPDLCGIIDASGSRMPSSPLPRRQKVRGKVPRAVPQILRT